MYLPLADAELRRKAYLGEMAVHRFCHHAVRVLNTSTKSPWRGRIKMRGTGEGVVTQAAMVDHMAAYMMPKKERADMRYVPVLCPYFHSSDLVGLSKVLVLHFIGLSSAWPDLWRTDESLVGCLFGKTNGVAVMFAVMHDLILESGGAQALSADFVKKQWAKVDAAVVQTPPPGGSKGYQAEVTAKVLSAMFGAGYDAHFRTKAADLKPQLRDAGALL